MEGGVACIHAFPMLVLCSCRIFIFRMKGNFVGHPVDNVMLDSGFQSMDLLRDIIWGA